MSYSEGDVAEFGCFRGGSTAILSMACALAGKRLFVFDSFQGVPTDMEYTMGNKRMSRHYQRRTYSAPLSQTQQTVKDYGCPDAVVWVPGFFKDTLPVQHDPERLCMVYVDVDVPLSQVEAFAFFWPKLISGGCLFSDESKVACTYQTYGEQSNRLKSLFEGVGYVFKD